MATRKTEIKQPDTKKKLEELLGEKLTDDAFARIRFIEAVATSSITGGFTTFRNILFPGPNFCQSSQLLDVSGVTATSSDGHVTFRLTTFLCPEIATFFGFPLNVVATPLSNTPCFLTVSRVLINNGTDVEFEVFSWDANGAPAPSVPFDWRCRVVLPGIVT